MKAKPMAWKIRGHSTAHRICETGDKRYPYRLACSKAHFGPRWRHGLSKVFLDDDNRCPECFPVATASG